MSWVKPNFLWMMYRSGWGMKPGEEIVLAVRPQRAVFYAILAEAVHSTFKAEVYPSEDAWRDAVARSAVRLQRDPDHDPAGASVARRAIQLGLRGAALARYARDWILEIEDVSAFVAEQRAHARPPFAGLLTPAERPYPVADAGVASRLGVLPTADTSKRGRAWGRPGPGSPVATSGIRCTSARRSNVARHRNSDERPLNVINGYLNVRQEASKYTCATCSPRRRRSTSSPNTTAAARAPT